MSYKFGNIDVYKIYKGNTLVYYDYDAAILAFKTRVLSDGGTYENETALRAFLPTLNIPNTTLALFPSSYKAGKIYSVIGNDFSVVRSTTKSRINPSGYIETNAVNVNAPDYSESITSILVENQDTNQVLNSSDITNASWLKTAGVASTDMSIINPYGVMGSKVFKNNPTGFSRVTTNSFMITANVEYVVTVIAKRIDNDTIRVSSIAGSGQDGVDFNFTTKSFLNVGAKIISYKYKELVNGWFKISIIYKTPTSESTQFFIRSKEELSAGAVPNASVAIEGIELKSIFGSYIKTESSIVTRNADIITVVPPIGTVQIKENFIDGAENIITAIPSSYQLPFNSIKSIIMTK